MVALDPLNIKQLLHLLLYEKQQLSVSLTQNPKAVAPVVRRLDNALHWSNRYPADLRLIVIYSNNPLPSIRNY